MPDFSMHTQFLGTGKSNFNKDAAMVGNGANNFGFATLKIGQDEIQEIGPPNRRIDKLP